MELPDYWLTRPSAVIEPEAVRAFDELWASTCVRGAGTLVEYDLPWPKWQFVCHLTDRLGLAAHGSGDPSIEEFEPRQPSDLTEFGNRRMVYAASDAIWAMFFAVVDRDRVDTIGNAAVRIEEDGLTTGPFYVFAVSRSALPLRPWRTGTLYLLPRDPFEQQPSMPFGRATVRFEQLASPQPVRPLAKLTIAPDDFPFLADVRGLDDARLQEYADAMMTGSPWPEE